MKEARGGVLVKRLSARATAARWALGFSLACIPFGCLGGQTGQPSRIDGGSCPYPSVEIPVDEPLRGVVPIEAAQGLEGSHTLPLQWTNAQGAPLAGVATDEITLTFTYDGGQARYNPCSHGGPDIELTLDVITRDSGLAESSTAWVSFYPPRPGPEPYGPSGESGSFAFESATMRGSGTLLPLDGATVVGFVMIGTSTLPAPLRFGQSPAP
jgi:hypothetical protein